MPNRPQSLGCDDVSSAGSPWTGRPRWLCRTHSGRRQTPQAVSSRFPSSWPVRARYAAQLQQMQAPKAGCCGILEYAMAGVAVYAWFALVVPAGRVVGGLGFLVLSMRRPLRRIVQFQCNAYSQKKGARCRAQKGELVLIVEATKRGDQGTLSEAPVGAFKSVWAASNSRLQDAEVQHTSCQF
jgi:hypothetical protein